MPMPHRGKRVQATVRLPVDSYREVAARSRARGWSMSDYIGWCVANELDPKRRTRSNTSDPLGFKPLVTSSREGQGTPYIATGRDDDDD